LKGGIGYIEMVFRCNILALVGGGKNPKYNQNKVVLWDDNKQKPIGELIYKTDVKGVRIKTDRIVVVLQNKIYVYNFSDLKLVDNIETSDNNKGVCALNTDNDKTVIACPHKNVGSILVKYKSNPIL